MILFTFVVNKTELIDSDGDGTIQKKHSQRSRFTVHTNSPEPVSGLIILFSDIRRLNYDNELWQ